MLGCSGRLRASSGTPATYTWAGSHGTESRDERTCAGEALSWSERSGECRDVSPALVRLSIVYSEPVSYLLRQAGSMDDRLLTEAVFTESGSRQWGRVTASYF